MSAINLPATFCSELPPFDFSNSDGAALRDYRRQVADENITLCNRHPHDIKSGYTLFQESEFRDFIPLPAQKMWKITELIITIWQWIVEKIKGNSLKNVEVVSSDTLDAAEAEVKAGGRVLVLNLASSEEPGGGFDEGIGTQEEELCWRSNLSVMMNQIKHTEQILNPEIWNLYTQILFTPNVTVFRNHSYAILENPFEVGILSCAAPVRPALKSPNTHSVDYADPKDKEKARLLIYNQLLIANEKGYDILILGAFGCGAFGNPPRIIARLYHEIIHKHFKDSFKKIVFAILDDPHKRAHNPEGNLAPFRKQFS